MKSIKLISIFFSLFAISCKEKTLFEQIKAEETGITFANRIIENDTMNIIDFEYVYNGSGVGIGDYNNDGLQDIFFSGNQVSNKLYLNKGNFKFEDVSKYAGIEGNGKWCAGVVTVDINNDGLMDVYVAATVKKPLKDLENLLYVNQGIVDGKPKFKEMAAEYGVNDNGHSENAAFFDYDNDGDLDLYVLTNIIDQYPNQYREKMRDGSNPNTDRLYRCDWHEKLGHPVYTNVSKETGITIEGYGLGLNICDINKDGFKDIYVTNDYLSDDLFYINDGNGKFDDMSHILLKHTSNSAMGNDVADINNDGNLDIFAVDMLAKSNFRKKVLTGPSNYQAFKFFEQYSINYQYMRNTMQINNGVFGQSHMPMFSEVSMLAGTAETDWSWTPSLADFDNDGNRDLLITNGFPKDVTDRDFMSFRNEVERLADRSFILEQIPVVKISNYAFRNKGNLEFENVTEKWGLNIPSFSNGAVYADLDNDGDLDYVVNNINDSAFVFKNTLVESDKNKESHFLRIKCVGDLHNRNGIGAVAELAFEDGEKMIHEFNPYRGYLSTVEPFIHFGLGKKKVKTLKIHWYNGKMQIIDNPTIDNVFEANIKNANQISRFEFDESHYYFKDITDETKVDFNHKEIDFIDFNVQNLIPFKLSELGPGMSVGDVNDDGLDDVYMGGPSTFSGLFFIQKTDGTYSKRYLLTKPEDPEKKGEDLGSLLFDADGDKDLDLYICRGGNETVADDISLQDALFLNDGKGNFAESLTALPKILTSTSCVRGADFDKDGDLDLFVSGRNVPGQYPKFTSSILLRNDSKNGIPHFIDISSKAAPAFKNIGLICDMLWTDYDNDGWMDIVLAGEFAEIQVFKNSKGKFEKLRNTGMENRNGLWNSINGGDFDNDGDTDYVVGNLGLNTLLKGTVLEPAKLVAKDFDNNGNFDVIPFVYFQDKNNERKLVPFNGKDDVNKQLNVTRQRFVSYKDFANADFENLLTKEEKKDAIQLDLKYNSSVLVENLGNGQFDMKPLPIQAQYSPINGIVVEDFDQDGNLDILISGNNYGNETSSGRYDAQNGTLLKGKGNCEFNYIPNSGFYVPYDSKSTVTVTNSKGELCIFASQNRGQLKVFKTNLLKQKQEIPSKAVSYEYKIGNKKVKRELYYGSSYLGQSARYITIPKGGKLLKIN